MKIAIYGRTLKEPFTKSIQTMVSELEASGSELLIYKPFEEALKKIKFKKSISYFTNHADLKRGCDLLISLGGDGTLLSTITLIKDLGIPILGINTGSLGFLSNVSIDEISLAIDLVLKKKFSLDIRSLVHLETVNNLFGHNNFGLNELTITRKDTSSMISIKCYINEELVNTYRADGLIIATPTGSTAYSLSCNGPIISPESKNFIINPIASHNLTVRPIVIPDDKQIKLKVEGVHKSFLVSLDSRTISSESEIELKISKAQFMINLVKLEKNNFFSTIRNKLMWGIDKRN